MSNITGPRSTSLVQKDDYSKKCHRVLRLHNCGHKTWVKRIVHVGCPHTPQSKKRCDNMASSARETYTNEPCSRCRPRTKELSQDPFDILLKRVKTNEKAQESIQSIAHAAFGALQSTSNRSGTVESTDLWKKRSLGGKISPEMVLLPDKPPLAEEKVKEFNRASYKKPKVSSSEAKQPENIDQDAAENESPNIDKPAGPASKSILASVWNLMKPNKSTLDADISTQNHEPDPADGWSDSEEEANWESMRNEGTHLWKDREDGWVHIK